MAAIINTVSAALASAALMAVNRKQEAWEACGEAESPHGKILALLSPLMGEKSEIWIGGERCSIEDLAVRAGQIFQTAPDKRCDWAREVELCFDRVEKATREERIHSSGGNIGMGIDLAAGGYVRPAAKVWPAIARANAAIWQYCYGG